MKWVFFYIFITTASVLQVHKTFDNATLYKVTDISQIIICDGAMPVSKKDRKKLIADGVENVKPEDPEEGTSEGKPKTARQIAKEVSNIWWFNKLIRVLESQGTPLSSRNDTTNEKREEEEIP